MQKYTGYYMPPHCFGGILAVGSCPALQLCSEVGFSLFLWGRGVLIIQISLWCLIGIYSINSCVSLDVSHSADSFNCNNWLLHIPQKFFSSVKASVQSNSFKASDLVLMTKIF